MGIYINKEVSLDNDILDLFSKLGIGVFSDYATINSIEQNCVLSIFDLRKTEANLSFDEVKEMAELMSHEIVIIALINPQNKNLLDDLKKYKNIILIGDVPLLKIILMRLNVLLNDLSELMENATTLEERSSLRKVFANKITNALENQLIENQLIENQLIEGANSNIHNLPLPRNPNFIGREPILSQLGFALNSNPTGIMMCAICGSGGVGKTQIANEYAYRFIARYTIIWWVKAESPITIAIDYNKLAEHLDLSGKDSSDQSIQTAAVKRWLENNGTWLLIFDDAQNPGDLKNYLPERGSGHVIITSRNLNWSDLATAIELQAFKREESMSFLLKIKGQSDEMAAMALANELADLPLALGQARAYIENNGVSLLWYLEHLRGYAAKVPENTKLTKNYPAAIAATWSLSFEAIREKSEAAADLLRLISFLNLDTIPRAFFIEQSKYLPEPLASVVNDTQKFDEVVRILRDYLLVDTDDNSISIHRLVRLMMRDWVNEDERKKWSDVTKKLGNPFSSIFKHESVPNWDDDALNDPHSDMLGRSAFARYLSARISLVPPNSEAYMIHLYGPWGTGKSTVLNFLRFDLEKNDQWLVVEYNAWQNQHIKPPWWSLMDGVFQAVKGKLKWHCLLHEYWWRFSAGNMQYLIGIIIAFAWILSLIVIPLLSQKEPNADTLDYLAREFENISKILAVIITIGGIAIAANRSLLFGSSKAAENYVRLTSDPMVNIKNHFKSFINQLEPKRVVVLIDDLDRCQSSYVVEIMEAIQTLFRKASVVIVVVADHRWLNACYEQEYEKLKSQLYQPGKPLGYLFLEKAFRFSTPIPGFSEDLKRKFWCHLLKIKSGESIDDITSAKKHADELISKAKNEGELRTIAENDENRSFVVQRAVREEAVVRLAAPDIMERLEHSLQLYCEFLEPNPRTMKRFVNTYSANRALALLSEIKIESHQLALWTVLQSRWPLLTEYLEKHPDLLLKIDKQNDLVEIPEEIKILLTDPEVKRIISGGSTNLPLQVSTVEQCTQLRGN